MNHHLDDTGPSDFDPTVSPTASLSTIYEPSMPSVIVSPDMSHYNTHIPLIPRQHSQTQPMAQPLNELQSYQMAQPVGQHRQTYSGVNFVSMQRHSSVGTARSDSPHMLGADVFGGPLPTHSELMDSNNHLSVGYDYTLPAAAYPSSDMPQGISPARALGPAPIQLQTFATPTAASTHNSHTTPTNVTHNSKPSLLSSSVGSSSDATSSVDRPKRHVALADTSEDENDSPTKRVGSRAAAREPPQTDSRHTSVAKKVGPLGTRTRPPPSKVLPTGRLNNKAPKDPGVEGIPPGPRSTERPQQSFACIIGQAILKSAAGGLSLEHIYRYVETAYPYFKTVDQWRNSVRHNLSIHKIFVTIPRTDKHPPGKGGIWVIDEQERIHWPSEDKFIKNFPPSHPHHAVCRQTLHERAVEKRLKEKAEAEGREYVPRKNKKVRKLNLKDDELKKTEVKASTAMAGPARPPAPMVQAPLQPPRLIRPPPSSPPRNTGSLPSFDFEDDGDFVPVGPDPPTFQLRQLPKPKQEHSNIGSAANVALNRRRFGDDDEENVFASGPKRVRVVQPEPLSPILEQQATTAFLNDDDDMFITPSRERSKAQSTLSSGQFSSSALKTPALIQTSSSPTSSPMPPTITRSSHHHPSALQQAWTHDDMMQTTPRSPRAKLDPAFDLKPTPIKRDRDDDALHFVPHVERGPPKTPVTRSSAAADRTPRIGGLRTPMLKTPLTYGSPARVPPSASAHLSTPLWEMSGVIDRMAESPTRTPRTDVPPTSPTHYSLSDCGDSPVSKRRKVAA